MFSYNKNRTFVLGAGEKTMKKKKRKYYLKPKGKLAVFLLICIMITGSLVHIFIGSKACGYSEPTCTAVTIIEGDTLWDMAETYKKDDTDIRKAIYTIKEVNNLQGSELQPGTEIYIPEDL